MSPSIADVLKMDATTHHHGRFAGLYEFRLQSSKEDSERMTSSAMMAATASSICSDQQSFYKQRIDSMFDETRSSVSGGGTPALSRRVRTVLDDLEEEDEEEEDDEKTPNTVQERIQKMFAEVTEDDENIHSSGREVEKNEDIKFGKSCGPKTAPTSKNTSSAPVKNQTFSVHYLGSAPLPNRDATLQALQSPLKTLYLKYRKLEMNGRAPPLNGTLEISEKGLRVKILGNEVNNKLESDREMDKLNKFPSIAVWAAVKFVSRKAEEDKENSTKYAFLPLIADPEGRDKSTLFHDLPEEEINYSCGAHSPMFAIVMRRSSKSNPSSQSVKKTLHCHAFVCACSEDAIVMAANLYQALVAGMSGGKKEKSKTWDGDPQQKILEESPRDIINRQETRSGLKKAMSVDGGDKPGKSFPPRPSDVMSSASAPVRPPRKKKSSNRYGDDARSSNSEDLLSVEEDDDIRLPLSRIDFRPNISRSLASLQSKNASPNEQSGDIFTKVAIPRTGSFLDHGAAVRRSSSMGLRDLFQEVRAQEGLTSLDDILEKIVDTDGMSFARLKPLYREFLLKLAATLSRDELYQRSKNIMRRQASSRRRRRRRRVGATATKEISNISRMDDDSSSTYGGGVACTGGKFSWALCSSVSKMKSKSSKNSREDEGRKKGNEKDSNQLEEGGDGTSCNFEFTSVIFPSEERPTRHRAGSSSISSSLSSTSRASKSRRQKRKQFHAHRPSFNAGRSIRGSQGQLARSGSNLSNKESQSRPKVSTSEDSSDFFSFKRRGTVDTNTKSSSRLGSLNGTGLGGGRSSSGYVSCSDCSFDSESCHSDKCYCSQEPHKRHPTSRLRRKESMRGRRCGEHCRNVEMPWCCCEAARNVPTCRARAGMGYSCGYRGACESTRCAAAAYKCSGHGKHSVHHCDRCSGVRRCSCSSYRNTQCTENPQSGKIQCEKRSSKGSIGGECQDEDDWEDEDAAVVVEDGASATSSSSWRPGAVVPKSRMDVYATLPPPRPLPDTPAKGSSEIYERCAKKKHEVNCKSRSSGMDVASVDMKQQKVLVVSARDPRGRVICMGRGDQPTLPPVGGRLVLPGPLQRCSKSAATEALSVKKSAEIAALFSNDKTNQRTEVIAGEEVVYTTLEPPKPSQIKALKTEFISKRGYYSKNSLESTLGYLP